MTKPYARGATRGEEGRISFSDSGAKKPGRPPPSPRIRSHKWVPFSNVRYPQLSDIEALGDSEDARANSEDARAGVPSRTNCSRPILPLMSCSLGMEWRHLRDV